MSLHDQSPILDQPAADALALERFRGYLLILARLHIGKQLGRKVDASDLVQQTLLDAHQKRAQFRGQGDDDLTAWLRQILANDIGMALRQMFRSKRDASREQDLQAQIDASSARLESILIADGESPSRQVVKHEMLIRLAEALLQLPEANREALVLRYCKSWSLAQISAHLERTPRAVAGLLQRGSHKLRELLEES